jgi:DNA invertase Pin-like site-specific DNA recombinase
LKVAIYARYSSDNQRDASIADQPLVCRESAQRQGWHVAAEYSDHAVSGATIMRPGFQAMMREALQKTVDIVMAEALDRFSRDQEDTAGLFKRLTFAGVNIVTFAEGDITHLHIGLKGTMNALFLKDLADKTRRGLRGRVELGKSGGGLCYGYKVTRATHDGAATTGHREVVHAEAEVIRRIFLESPAIHQRPGYREARLATKPSVRVGDDRRPLTTNRRGRAVESGEGPPAGDAPRGIERRSEAIQPGAPTKVSLLRADEVRRVRRRVRNVLARSPRVLRCAIARHVHQSPTSAARRWKNG